MQKAAISLLVGPSLMDPIYEQMGKPDAPHPSPETQLGGAFYLRNAYLYDIKFSSPKLTYKCFQGWMKLTKQES
ncbi:hypothetical protein O181_095525 [Austropuccinia psidii MF-1]|uniref:Uncharacterized protein n=1 Tax=Austropuccinia psidii MF-1 TaxID=1389203 RepID=A0A9Q3J3Z2_9BASI|nr:hypothetical protein [Austropuccinia psidii MF-1]